MKSFFKNTKISQMSDSFLTAIFIVFSGGFQDAYTYMCRGEVFANAQTGNIVLMAANLFQREFSHCLRYLIPVVSFMIGTFVAEQIHSAFKHYEKIHWRQIIILIEIVLLFAVGFITQRHNALANAVVSFVCAMQVQTFRKVRGHVYASTMCIGNMRSAMESISAYMRIGDKSLLRKSLQYFLTIFVFACGAGIGGAYSLYIGNEFIWISCALLLICFVLMFIKSENDMMREDM